MIEKTNGGLVPPFYPVPVGIETRGEIASSIVEDNIAFNITRDVPRLHLSPDFGKYKGRKIAVVAGGPSLKKTIDELRAFDGDVMACGTVHDHLVECGVKFDYALMCDPDPVILDWVRRPQKDCKYLLSSSLDRSVYDWLSEFDVLMWHCHGGEMTRFRGEPAINGGCTVTLRAICVAILMGYFTLHFFGLDSSFDEEADHHAYAHHVETSNRTLVRVGGEDGRVFSTTVGWLAQASQFQEMLKNMGHMFEMEVHGDGMIAEIMRVAKREYATGVT